VDDFNVRHHFSSPVVVGDLNLHLEISESADPIKFTSLLETNNCCQYVDSSAHTAGHLLDVFIARTDRPVRCVVETLPGGLSDHSLIVAHVSSLKGLNDYINRRCRTWGSFDIDNFMGDFDSLPLATTLQNDSSLPHTPELFDLYFDTISALLDRHASFPTKCLSNRRLEPFFDHECHKFRRSTSRLERAYRVRSELSLMEWRSHFHEQRRVFHQKSEIYWSTAIAGCHVDSKKLWSAVNQLIQPVNYLERSTSRQTLLFTSPPKARNFLFGHHQRSTPQPSTYVNQLRSPTLFLCPLNKPPSC